nr:SDR family NAD(P)-dependent oxidoreductase [uncultured Chryseobacterium sp.]
MLNLKGQIVFVTGAGRGIGKAIAIEFAKRGASVAVAGLNEDFLKNTVEEIEKYGAKGIGLVTDVTSLESVRNSLNKVVSVFGRLDIAVNNAGVIGMGSIDEIEPDEWDRVLNVNAKGVFICTKAELEIMKPQGSGAIINNSSIAGKMGMAHLSHYVASKFAVIGFTNSIAKEIASTGITVNAICPGIVGTGMWRGEGGIADRWKLEGETEEQSWERNKSTLIPQGIDQTSEDIAEAVVFISQAKHLTGQAIAVDGGMTM